MIFSKALQSALPIGLIATAACGSAIKDKKMERPQPYAECVEKLLLPSKALVQRMKDDGVDLTKERLVTHLIVGNDEAITEAAKLFKERGFDILESSKGRLLLGDMVPVSDEWVSQTVPAMCHKSEQLGLSYDGWDIDMSGAK